MRYIADSNGYLKGVSFGAYIVCDTDSCVEYTGAVPVGYSSLDDWFMQECEKLYRWYISGGNLTLDLDAEAPDDDSPILITADDVGYKEGRISEYMPVALTQDEYDALEAAGELNAKTPYLIVSD